MALEERLRNLRSVADLRALLIEEIGFDQADEVVFFPDDNALLREEYPKPAVIAVWEGFSVILLVSASRPVLAKARQRIAIDALRKHFPFALYVFADPSGTAWHWVFPRQDSGSRRRILRRMEVEAGEVRLHTIAERLQLLKQRLGGCENGASVAALVEQVFDVEAVSKAFYRNYAEQFKLLKDAIKNSNHGKDWIYRDDRLSRYVQLLMGRVLFLHFIEKKGWLDNNRDFIQTLHAPYRRGEKKEFYSWVLAPLFFKALNKPGRTKTIDGREYDIRFLNGGLFEERREFEEHDLLMRPVVPDEVLSNFLAMLGRYNFTVDESTPLDQTVGIDPEMLGKVFENLLEEESRHQSGTYYTPRTIVEYMCRETLFQCLNHGCGIDRAAYEDLYDAALEGRKANLDPGLADRVEGLLDRVRVLDPAVGSGAFLLGTLQEIVTLKESLARSRGESEERLRAHRAERKERVIHDSLYGVDISPPAIEIARLRLWLALVVDEDEPKALPNFDYHIVRGDTLRTLFEGEPILPRQAKPPLTETDDWLKPASNPHTEALLRYMDQLYSASGEAKAELRRKIRHTLKDMIEERWSTLMSDLEGRRKQLESADTLGRVMLPRDKHLATWRQLGEKQDAIKAQRRKLEASLDTPDDLDLPFTPLHLYFAEVFTGDDPGFHIAIANPPYIRIQELRAALGAVVDEYARDFESATGNFDIYALFAEKALQLLRSNGVMSFIMPNKFHNADYGAGLRALIAKGRHLVSIVDFLRNQPFDATTYTHVLTLGKAPHARFQVSRFEQELRRAAFEPGGAIAADLVALVAGEKTTEAAVAEYAADRLTEEPWVLPTGDKKAVLEKLLGITTKLADISSEIFVGLQTSADPIYILEFVAEQLNGNIRVRRPETVHKGTKKVLPAWEGELEPFLLKPFFKDGVVDAYYLSPPEHRLIFPYDLSKDRPRLYTAQEIQTKAPLTWAYLSEELNQRVLRARESGKMNHDAWWAYVYPKNLDQFEKEKLILLVLAERPRMAIDREGTYFTGGGNGPYYGLRVKDQGALSLTVLQAILCSSVTHFLMQSLSTPFRGNYYSFGKRFIERLPIVVPEKSDRERLESLVAAITQLKRVWHESGRLERSLAEIGRLESEIDDLVLDIYGLTEAERQLVCRAAGVAQSEEPCQDESKEASHEPDRSQKPANPPEPVAGKPRRRGKSARGVPAPAAEPGAALHGLRARASESGTPETGAGTASTTPLDATRQLDTADGALCYSEVAERLALRIIDCLEEILALSPEAIHISAEWIANVHRCIAGELFPDWAGKFRTMDVQVGTHLPPSGHDVPVHVRNFCLDLEERLRHLAGVESLAALLAWVDWRFQWIHPFKDFNGRVGRILLTALLYKLKLPPVDPSPVDEKQRVTYLAALRAADGGDMQPLSQVWVERLSLHD